jgi:NAD(P)-dependent dehydrogenase (short-subunit alcohol dehydrogenase family)
MKKTFVVTGVGRGIGRSVLQQAAKSDQCGCVVGICRPGSPHMKELEAQFKGNNKVYLFEADVSDFSTLENVVNELKKMKIEPDFVLANAGTLTPRKPLWEATQAELEHAFKVDVLGSFNTMKAFIPMMKHREGAVIANVSGDWGLCDNYGCGTFCMAKFAIEGLVKAASCDVDKDKLSIVTVSPGSVVTDLLIEAVGGEAEARKVGTPVEEFTPQFFEKLWSVSKSHSGQHMDFGVKKAARAG